MDILFCSRGRGRGHAVRDLAIAEEIRLLAPALKIAFVSYSAGATVFRAAGETVYDLGLPERNPFPETILRTYRTIMLTRPRLIVAQEELGALTAAAITDTKAIFTTHWFARSKSPLQQALSHAHRIIFMEEPGIFKEPFEVHGRVTYVGPVLRRFSKDLLGVRQYNPAASGDVIITVLPGSAPEEREPIVDLVASAYEKLPLARKRLVWVAGADYDHIARRLQAATDTIIVRWSDDIDALILNSSVIITKGTYNIGREVMALGKPSISLTHRYNWVDDTYASMWPNNLALLVPSTSVTQLTTLLEEIVGRGCYCYPRWDLILSTGAADVARELLREL